MESTRFCVAELAQSAHSITKFAYFLWKKTFQSMHRCKFFCYFFFVETTLQKFLLRKREAETIKKRFLNFPFLSCLQAKYSYSNDSRWNRTLVRDFVFMNCFWGISAVFIECLACFDRILLNTNKQKKTKGKLYQTDEVPLPWKNVFKFVTLRNIDEDISLSR